MEVISEKIGNFNRIKYKRYKKVSAKTVRVGTVLVGENALKVRTGKGYEAAGARSLHEYLLRARSVLHWLLGSIGK